MSRAVFARVTTVLAVAMMLVLVLAIQPTRADDESQQGNVDCYGPLVGPADVLAYLGAVGETGGVPRDCSVLLSTWPPCPSPVSPTQCDVPVYYIPTTSPGEALPARLDFNCDRQRNVLDVLAMLSYWSGVIPSRTPCVSTRPSVSPFD